MDFPILIGIHGVKRAGKNTTANAIAAWAAASSPALSVRERGFADKAKLAFARQFSPTISMADAIKWVDMHKDDNGMRVVVEHKRRPVMHEADVQFRQCLAQFATEGARDIYGDDFWVDQLLPLGIVGKGFIPVDPYNQMQPIDPMNAKWCHEFVVGDTVADICPITDIRFENEVRRINSVNGINVKIRRKDAEQAVIEEARRQGRDIHASELGLPDEMFDFVINNDDNNLSLASRRTYQMMGILKTTSLSGIKRNGTMVIT